MAIDVKKNVNNFPLLPNSNKLKQISLLDFRLTFFFISNSKHSSVSSAEKYNGVFKLGDFQSEFGHKCDHVFIIKKII